MAEKQEGTGGPATGAWSGKAVHAPVRSHWQSVVFAGPCGKPDCDECPDIVTMGRSLYETIPGWLFDSMCMAWAEDHGVGLEGACSRCHQPYYGHIDHKHTEHCLFGDCGVWTS